MSFGDTFNASAKNALYLAVSKMPAIPITRVRGNFEIKCAWYVITSSGLLTTIIIAFGECFTTFSVTVFTIPALVLIKSSRVIPGFLGRPEVITTTSEFALLL